MTSLLKRLLIDEDGQDLIEYTLLTATIALASVAAVTSIGGAINTAYTAWDTATQDIWEPQNPTP